MFLINLLLPFRLAWKSIIANKGRTILTLIGIVIGIAAVIIVMSAGESLKGLIMGQIDAFGSDIIQIETKVPSSSSVGSQMSMAEGVQITTLKLSDAEVIKKLSNVKNYYSYVIGQAVVSYLGENKVVNYMGISPSFVDIDQSKVAKGVFFTQEEDNSLARVVVLGSKVAEKLFADSDPIGQQVKIGKNKFMVIGVLAERGGSFGFSFDDIAYIPIQTAQKLMLGIDHVMAISAQVKDSSLQDDTADEIIALLRDRHDITDPKDDDFQVTTMQQAREMIDTIFGGITLLLVALAGISLLVGGIGIMNIMYVSVTERTFEIGLRKSIGAKRGQILWQFLWEAVFVTSIGGVIGVAIGALVSFIVMVVAGQLGFTWTFSLPLQAVVIAFVFCAGVGLIFGYFPAKKAAKMDPINALRKE
ncbi:MAG: ABC transporter permease [Patescibacteria group bacterium]|jgi:putative ABC transport system permease protein